MSALEGVVDVSIGGRTDDADVVVMMENSVSISALDCFVEESDGCAGCIGIGILDTSPATSLLAALMMSAA